MLSAACSPDAAKAPAYTRNATRDPGTMTLGLPSEFAPERGVSWDGRIRWATEERVWVFAAALELSLKEVIRPDSPFHLNVTVVRAEKRTGTFVVEFSILAPSGESVELLQVEGVGPRDRSVDEVSPVVAGEIVTTFKKSVLQ
jgi:hypothetical protein